MTIHVYTKAMQPATRYLIDAVDPPMVITTKPGVRIRTMCCRKKRIAANLQVRAYYDGCWYWCVPGKGCKR